MRKLALLLLACGILSAQFTPPAPTSATPSGPAGGQLGGTYPNPTVLQLNGVAASDYARLSVANMFTGLQTVTLTTNQQKWCYDVSNCLSLTVGATGSTTLASVGTNPNITLTPGGTGYVGISTNLGFASGAYQLGLNGTRFSTDRGGSYLSGIDLLVTGGAGVIINGATGNVLIGTPTDIGQRTAIRGALGIYGGLTDASNLFGLTATSADGTFTFATATAGTGADDQSIVFTPSGAGIVRITGASFGLNGKVCTESAGAIACV